MQNWKLCPRSDSKISQWRISFESSSIQYICSDMAFNTFNVCINNRETLLVIKREQFEEKYGTYNFNFRSNGQTFSLQIRFGKLTS